MKPNFPAKRVISYGRRLALLCCAFILFSSPVLADTTPYPYAEDFGIEGMAPPADAVLHVIRAERERGLDIRGQTPVFSSPTRVVADRVNAQIEEAVVAKVARAHETRARSINFSYEIFYYNNLVSIVLQSTTVSATTRTEVVSINFNMNTGATITAAGAVGGHIVQLADRVLAERIRRNPESYNAAFSRMRRSQAFSVTDQEITFWFDEFQLSATSEGLSTLVLDRSNIREFTLRSSQYHTRSGFNIKMVPLGITATALGYTVRWNEDTRTVGVYLQEERLIELHLGVNRYERENRFTITLEAAPEIIDDFTFVPISFFDRILSLVAYSVDSRGNIIFASYV